MAITAFLVAGAGSGWGGIADGGDGHLYAVPYKATTFGKVDPAGPSLTTFGSASPTADRYLSAIRSGGRVWAAPYGDSGTTVQAAEIDPSSGTVALHDPPSAGRASWGTIIAAGGFLWATPVKSGRRLYRINPGTATAELWPPPIDVLDDFTRSPGPIGGGWTTLIGSGWTISPSGSARPPTGECTIRSPSGSYSDVAVAATITGSFSTWQYVGVTARMADANNLYLAQVNGAGTLSLYRRVSGTWTQIGADVSTGASGVLALRAHGTTISTFWNDVPVHSVTDSAHSSGSIGMRADSATGAAVTSFGLFHAPIPVGAGTEPQQGVAAAGGDLFLTPGTRSNIIRFHSSTGAFTEFGGPFTTKWLGAVTAPNGLIYCPPQDAGDVLVINPTTETTSTIATPSRGSGEGWGMPHLAADGLIYCPPWASGSVLVIDPSAATAHALGSGLSGTFLQFGTINGTRLVAVPVAGSTSFLVVDDISPTRNGWAVGRLAW